jgi:hypothetical protein
MMRRKLEDISRKKTTLVEAFPFEPNVYYQSSTPAMLDNYLVNLLSRFSDRLGLLSQLRSSIYGDVVT